MSDEKKVLIDVDIKATAALKELAELRIKADELRKAQKELDTTTEEGGGRNMRQLGQLRYNAGRDIEIYDYYLSEVDITGSRMQAQTNCAMRYNLSEKAIQVIVYGFENRLRGV